VLNSRGKLTAKSFDIIKPTPRKGWEILQGSPEIIARFLMCAAITMNASMAPATGPHLRRTSHPVSRMGRV